jgi:plastocyanin
MAVLGMAVMLILSAGGCGKILSGNNAITSTIGPSSHTSKTYEPSKQPQVQIEITLSGLVPPIKTVKSGTNVTWLNGLEGEIQLISDQGLFGAWVDDRGAAYSFTFDKPGEYSYEIYGIQQYTGLIIVIA